jgi:hypothetical protein
MDVDMFRTQRKWEAEGQRLGSVYIHIQRKGPSNANGNKTKKRRSYAETNKFYDIKVQNTSHQQTLYKYSVNI